MSNQITDAIVRHMQEGSSKSAHNVIRVCCQEGYPDFDDGAVLKEVFASPEFKLLVARSVQRQLTR